MTRQAEIALKEVQKLDNSEFDIFFATMLENVAKKFGVIYQIPQHMAENNIWYVSILPVEQLMKIQPQNKTRNWNYIGKAHLGNDLNDSNIRDMAYSD
jgi:hypothetical protein